VNYDTDEALRCHRLDLFNNLELIRTYFLNLSFQGMFDDVQNGVGWSLSMFVVNYSHVPA